MSIYAQNYTIDEVTGEKKLVKHLNKIRVDRGCKPSSKWNKSGKKTRREKWLPTFFEKGSKKLEYQIIQREINKEKE